MVHQYKYIVFDLDGTLLDTSLGIIYSIEHVIKLLDLEPLDSKEMNTFIGPPIQDSFKRYYDVDDSTAIMMADLFRNDYKANNLFFAQPYQNICSVIEKIREKGIRMAIATYKREDYAITLSDYFGFNKYIDVISGADFNNKLSKCDIVKNALSCLGVNNYEDVLMIGDSINDVIAAKAAGVDFLGVTYGFGFKTKGEVLSFNAVGCAESTKEILLYLFGVEDED